MIANNARSAPPPHRDPVAGHVYGVDVSIGCVLSHRIRPAMQRLYALPVSSAAINAALVRLAFAETLAATTATPASTLVASARVDS